MIETKRIDSARAADLRLKNDPFPLTGFLRPTYADGHWDYVIERLPEAQVTSMCFPDEDYDFDALAENSFCIGAYDGDACVGLAIYQRPMFRYLYLMDLKVSAAYRRMGAGRQLIDAGMRLARELGYRGVYLIVQDNNLTACEFYLRCGFRIGGLDTEVYAGTSQAGKRDIMLYLDL